ncbi:MAG: transposase [Oxalobacteraceae bacterium]|nr:MAG: transposase [Oxalobacteraceae bacterium]
MRQSKFTESQIVEIVRQADQPKADVSDLCRKNAISEATLYRWKRRFGDMTASQVSRLRQLEQENVRMRKLIVDRDLELDVAKELLKKTSEQRRAAASLPI